jgi:protein associated with RNAse G/E
MLLNEPTIVEWSSPNKDKGIIEYRHYKQDGSYILHREGGPAVEYTNGNKWWYRYGKHHREDGPAIEYANGDKQWFLEDERIREEDFETAVKIYKASKMCF